MGEEATDNEGWAIDGSTVVGRRAYHESHDFEVSEVRAAEARESTPLSNM